MSQIHTRYRKGLTNLGVVCGFATNTEDGRSLHLLNNGCTEMGWIVERTESARPAEYDFEPVVAICHMTPPDDEWAKPRMQALHVTRMPLGLLPIKLVWRARDWPTNTPFYPYHEPHHSYNFPESLLNTLPDTADYPDWLLNIAADEPTIQELITKSCRVRSMQNTWILTGHIKSGPITEPVETSYHESKTPYVPLELWQTDDPVPFHLRLPTNKQDAWQFSRKPIEMNATVLCHGRMSVFEHNNGRVLRSQPIFRAEEILVPSPLDVESSP